MAVAGNFDQLVSNLTLEERQNLLLKLKAQNSISADPLYTTSEADQPGQDIATEYAALPWFYRLWYFILSFFRAKAPEKLYEDRRVMDLGAMTEEKSPGLYNAQKGLLMPAFHRHLGRLKDAARFFYSTLDTSVNRDKGSFFAFLGSLEMEEIHRSLQTGTDPGLIIEKNPELPDMELRQMAFKAMDEALNSISEENRNAMYFSARTLNCLKELSSFLYDRVLIAFGNNASVNGEACSVNVVKELLMSLNNVLHSLAVVPQLTLLESLFVFSLQERSREPGFDLGREIRGLMVKAEESLAVIREFNVKVPLTWIIRCATRDMTYTPRQISGGEDWFVVYREYWKRHVESLFSDFLKDRRHRELLNTFKYFLKGSSLKILANSQSETSPDGLPVKGAFGLSFIRTFYSAVFMPDINRFLRPILIDGEFQKKENRAEYTESYNNLIKLEDDIIKFEYELSPSGDFGKRYAQARQDMSALPIKRRKIQIVVDEASGKAWEIVEQARDASRNIINILNGILGNEFRGKYDSLINMSKLAARDLQFTTGLNDTVQQLRRLIQILDDIEKMENGR